MENHDSILQERLFSAKDILTELVTRAFMVLATNSTKSSWQLRFCQTYYQ